MERINFRTTFTTLLTYAQLQLRQSTLFVEVSYLPNAVIFSTRLTNWFGDETDASVHQHIYTRVCSGTELLNIDA